MWSSESFKLELKLVRLLDQRKLRTASEVYFQHQETKKNMSLVNVINVIVLNPKATYSDKISFEIFFEALQPLQQSKLI